MLVKTVRRPYRVLQSSANHSSVRVSAKELTSLILDEERLRSERSDRKLWKSRVQGIDEYGPQAVSGPSEPRRQPRRQRPDEDDTEFKLALEASKQEAEEEERRRKNRNRTEDTDDDLAKAIRLSKEEEELRRRELEDKNAASLFDDTPAPSQPQPTGWNQGYQQQSQVDWFGNPIQQAQPTGYLNNQYSQPTGMQAQQPGYPNGFSNGFGAQPTGYDQFGQQPNYGQQQNTMQPQQTAFNNPYAQAQTPNDVFGQQSPQQSIPQPGSHNPWATGAQQQADSLKPMPTGSNNPFASGFGRPQPQSQKTSPPTLQSLSEQSATNTFTSPNPISNFQAPPQQQRPQQPQKPMDPQRERLNALLASGEGQDTFGNVGDLRIPAQHTAPGTFVNSAGGGMDRLRAAQTGNNPFFSQQFTGQPQTGGSPFGGMPQQQQQQVGNSFGARPGGQPGQGGSLIDF